MSLKEESVFIPSEEEVISEDKVEKKVGDIFEEIVVGVELNNIENDIKKSLNDLFLNIIKTCDEKNNYFTKIGIQLSNETLDIIKKIIESNNTLLDEIEKGLLEVLKDNKIDASDIPQFILIVQILYERILNQKNVLLNPSKPSEICLIILKFIIHTLVEERKIIIQEEKKVEFLSQLDKLIESCISLLNFPSLFKTPKNCCNIM